MAEDPRTPDSDQASDPSAPSTAPVRRRRRAGSPVGAPTFTAPGAATESPSERRTSVPEQTGTTGAPSLPTTTSAPQSSTSESTGAESPATTSSTSERAPQRRRRAGAPAGPPTAPVFSTGVPASPAPAAEEDDAEESSASRSTDQTTPSHSIADRTSADRTARTNRATENPAANADEDQADEDGTGSPVAADLAALAKDRPAESSRRRSRGNADADRRERAQLDFASLLFQAPEARAEEDRRAFAGSADHEQAAPHDEESTNQDDSPQDDARQDDARTDERPARRSRSRRATRSTSAPEADSAPREHTRSASDHSDAEDGEDQGAEEDTRGNGRADREDSEETPSRRRRRRGGRGRRGRGRGEDDAREDAEGSEDTSDEDSSSSDRADADAAPARRRRRRGDDPPSRGSDDADSDTRDSNDPDVNDPDANAQRSGADDRGAEDSGAEDTDSSDAEDASDREDQEKEPSRSSGRSRSRGRRSSKGRGRSEDSASADDDSAEQDHAGEDSAADDAADSDDSEGSGSSSRRRRRRRRSGSGGSEDSASSDDPPNTVVKVRERRDEVKSVKGSTRLEAKKQRRREGRDAGRRRSVITEAEFLARRESVKRSMIVRERPGRTQIAVLEDDVLVEHYVAQKAQTSMVGNVYLGKVQNVLPSMEAAFVDIGKGRNAVLYAGEVNWDAAGLEGQPRRIELALKSGDSVLVQVTKDPIGHKGARLTSQISLPGRYVVFVPGGSMTGISRKLPDNERSRLKKILKQVIPEDAGVIVRTAAEGASEEELTHDVERLRAQWDRISKAQRSKTAPVTLSQEPDLATKVVRDVFNEDFTSLIVEGDRVYDEVHEYVQDVAPDLLERVTRHVSGTGDDAFAKHRVDEQLLKAMDRKVYLPSGGSLVIDRTEAMTVIDVNTGKFTGAGGSLEETVTRNNLEAAEEIVRQLRLRDIGGIIVIDFIDMVLESNRDLVLRRLVECLGRDRTKHQVAEVTSLGLVQMTRKRVSQGLVETFSSTCEACNGRGVQIDIDGSHHHEPSESEESGKGARRRGRRGGASTSGSAKDAVTELAEGENVHRLEEDTNSRELARATIASIAKATTGQVQPEVTVDGQLVSVGESTDSHGDQSDSATGTSGTADAASSDEAPQG